MNSLQVVPLGLRNTTVEGELLIIEWVRIIFGTEQVQLFLLYLADDCEKNKHWLAHSSQLSIPKPSTVALRSQPGIHFHLVGLPVPNNTQS